MFICMLHVIYIFYDDWGNIYYTTGNFSQGNRIKAGFYFVCSYSQIFFLLFQIFIIP